MTGSTGKFIFEVYYDLLWNAAYQHDLNNAEGQKQRKAFISIKLIHLMNMNMILEKIQQMRMILPQTLFFNLFSTLLNLNNLVRFYSQPTLGRIS